MGEASVLRAVYTSKGPEKLKVFYHDGRQITDGRDQTGDPELAKAHDKPADVVIAPAMGRLDRNSPGDANNDGYSEREGVYKLIASGGRVEFQIKPQAGVPVPRPVVEISGLPKGKILATMEGRLVEVMVRLPDGRVLLELPGTLTRATTVNVRISL
jgi:hypothetical protein